MAMPWILLFLDHYYTNICLRFYVDVCIHSAFYAPNTTTTTATLTTQERSPTHERVNAQ